MKIFRFNPQEEWNKLKGSLMNIETSCYHENLRETEEGKKGLLSLSKIALVAEVDDKIVGESYAMLPEDYFEFYKEWTKPDEKELLEAYKKNNIKALWYTGLAVLPEYRGNKLIGPALVRELISEAKKEGYEFLVFLAKEGSIYRLAKRAGAKMIKVYENLLNSGEIYYLCELSLKKIPTERLS